MIVTNDSLLEVADILLDDDASIFLLSTSSHDNYYLLQRHRTYSGWITDDYLRHCTTGNLKALQYFHRIHAIDREIIRSKKNRALHYAAFQGWLSVVKYLIETFDLSGEEILDSDHYVWINVITSNSLPLIKYFVETFNMTTADARYNDNLPLKLNASHGYLQALKYLVDTFDLTADDARSDNNYALRWAASNGHSHVVEYLQTTFGLSL